MSRMKNVAGEAILFANQAERQIASLTRDLKTMRDAVSGLERGIRAPAPKGGSRYTKRTVSKPSPFLTGSLGAVGRIFSGSILDATGLGGYPSSAQVASSYISAFQKAQRIM
jgi:hypothetical protein